MNVNPVEWNQAQVLLLKLVQTLVPLTQGFVPKHHPDMVPLDKRLFIPNLGENSSSSSFPYAVRLLTSLRSTQEQMHELMEKLPDEGLAKEEEEGVLSKKDGVIQNEKKSGDAKSALSNVRGESKAGIPKKEITLSSKPPISPSVSEQAQKLIIQVRDAIGNLSTSMNLVDPRAALLREALKRLKPMVDALILEVTQSDMNSMDEGQHQPFRFSVPSSPRSHLFKKEIPFPQSQPAVAKEVRGEARFRADSMDGNEEAIQRGRREDHNKSSSENLSSSKGSSISKPNQPQTPQDVITNRYLPYPKGERDVDIKPADPKALPGAPFLSNSFQLLKKDKKKRKGLWSNDDQEQSKENT